MAYEKYLFTRRALVGGAIATSALVATRGAQAADAFKLTAESPMGPFYPVARPNDEDADLTWIKGHKKRAIGDVIEVTGRVLDRHGKPIRGAVLELWQCNAAGRYAHPSDIATAPLDPDFQGYGAIRTGSSGEWRLRTVKPAGYSSPIGFRTPHIHFDIRGRAQRMIAQMYFPEDHATNSKDELYKRLGEDAITSMSAAVGEARYRWDIVMMEG